MKHVMIDLETIGNDYDGVFTTIGACLFDPNTGEIGGTFYCPVNWESSIDAGRTVTPETLKWWMKQNNVALNEIMREGMHLHDALISFADWLPKESIVWGNGPNFDIGKLETAYGRYLIPWEFHSIRCVRTIRDLAEGLVDRDDVPFEGTKHNALDDAVYQATYVSKMWQALRNR